MADHAVRRRHRRLGALGAALLTATAVAAGIGVAPVAAAGPAPLPATAVNYPSGASGTRFDGFAFDTCSAPPLTSVLAWRASPYRAIGVYIGGGNRSCAQPNLTKPWVGSVTARGWSLLPIWLGLQAPCSDRTRSTKIDPARATAQGTAEARQAIDAARALGMVGGTAIYNDMENYDPNDASCRAAVLGYLSAWTKELHRNGFLSGVYGNLGSAVRDLTNAYLSPTLARPDALWVARWDGSPTLTGLAGVPDSRWQVWQRVKQYRGDHDETWGGVRINIDSNRVKGPVATVPRYFPVTRPGGTVARSAPRGGTAVRAYPVGTSLAVVCQAPGGTIGGTSVWNKLSNGSYVTDRDLGTPSTTTPRSGYSPGVPRCWYPYQTTTDQLTKRTLPSATSTAQGSLAIGSLAWVQCQATGSAVGSTRVWDRIDTGAYVTDRYLATPSSTSFSTPVPRC